MLALLCSLVLASPASTAPTKVLVMDLKSGDIDEGTVRLVDDLVAAALSRHNNLEVVSGADVRRMVELEAEKTAADCDEAGSCLAEIAGALGASHVVFGRVGKLGETLVMTLNLYDSAKGKSVNRTTVRGADIEEVSGAALEAGLLVLMAPIAHAEKAAPLVDKKTEEKKAPKLEPSAIEEPFPVVPVSLGGGGLVLSGLAFAIDSVVPSSQNGRFDVVDFVLFGAETVGIAAAAVGGFYWMVGE